MRDNTRDEVERKCRQILEIAANSADEKRESVYSAYFWARTTFYGMSETFFLLGEMELYHLTEYYYDIADNKITKAIWLR